MPRNEPLEKVTLLMFPGDFKRLQELFPDYGASLIVRTLVRSYIKKVEGETSIPKLEIEL